MPPWQLAGLDWTSWLSRGSSKAHGAFRRPTSTSVCLSVIPSVCIECTFLSFLLSLSLFSLSTPFPDWLACRSQAGGCCSKIARLSGLQKNAFAKRTGLFVCTYVCYTKFATVWARSGNIIDENTGRMP